MTPAMSVFAPDDDDDSDSYADRSAFLPLFATESRTSILAALVGERGRDLSVTDVAELAGVARSTVYDHLDDLLDLGVVERVGEEGERPTYRLNEDSEIADELVKLEDATLDRLYELEEE